MTAIERHCRWLLLTYPRSYRENRGDEIVGTLLEASGPNRSWPSRRDTRALILSGLRVRAGLGQRLTVRASLLQSLLLAAVLVLAYQSALALGFAAQGFISGPWGSVLGLATLAVMAGAWFGPPRVVAVMAFATAGLWAYQPPERSVGQVILPVLALVCVAALTFRRERLPRPWLWLVGPWYLAYLADFLFEGSALYEVAVYGLCAILAATIAWGVLDVRPMLALALAIAGFGGGEIATFSGRGFRLADLVVLWPNEAIVVVSLAIIVAAIRRLRRQALI
jgi:hypothetical protein